jgi:hypothetical protein
VRHRRMEGGEFHSQQEVSAGCSAPFRRGGRQVAQMGRFSRKLLAERRLTRAYTGRPGWAGTPLGRGVPVAKQWKH